MRKFRPTRPINIPSKIYITFVAIPAKYVSVYEIIKKHIFEAFTCFFTWFSKFKWIFYFTNVDRRLVIRRGILHSTVVRLVKLFRITNTFFAVEIVPVAYSYAVFSSGRKVDNELV